MTCLSRIRERYGLEVFRRFFETIVVQSLEAGLVWGKEVYLDATKVAANATLASLRPRFAVEAHLAHLFAVAGGDGDGGTRGVTVPAMPTATNPRRPRQVTADTKYGTVENIVAIEGQEIRASFPLSEVGQRPGMFGEQDFVYDAATHLRRTGGSMCHLCAAGAVHHGEAGSAHRTAAQ